ncbi:SFT2 [Scenedesmus sp. PABB004]|nr:SFT2 [Scenedesmus sp. PABB004]
MDALRGWLPGGGGAAAAAPVSGGGAGPGLLADWSSYQQTADVEAGGGAGGGIAKTAEELGSSLGSFFTRSYAAISDGIGAVGSTSLESSLPSGTQLVHFAGLLGCGLLFLACALFIGLPTLLLSPSKFALFFTIGCCLVLSAFAALKGWRAQVAHMLERERLPFSAGYVGAVALTLYAALIMKSYVLSLGCSALQVVALLYYLTSYYPGGTSSVRYVLSMFGSMFGSCASSCGALLFGGK